MVTFGNKQLCSGCFAPIKKEPCKKCGFSTESYSADKMVLPAGSILMGNFIVGRLLGKGGFGITYQAYDVKYDHIIAIKEYFPVEIALRNNEDLGLMVRDRKSAELFRNGVEKFYNEAAFISDFSDDPNIVSVYQLFYENNTAYFTMEYLSGITLKDYVIRCGCITAEQAAYIADGVCSALIGIHEKNVLHRDVSPDNIMLCRDGGVKLLDFGAARQVFPEGSQLLSVILKPGFAPLEQYMRSGKQGEWTDVYSLAASLYYALTKQIPEDPQNRFEDDSELEKNMNKMPPALWQVVKKAMEVKYTDRYRSSKELKDALSAMQLKRRPVKIPAVLAPAAEADSPLKRLISKLFGS
ncbi:MAG: serine/threonine protein kinase [Bacteroides sp.]|nr:serine/threonine protein kinase [Bacteroides sp.]